MMQTDSGDKNHLGLRKEFRRAHPINVVFIHKWSMPVVFIIIKLKSTITDLATYITVRRETDNGQNNLTYILVSLH